MVLDSINEATISSYAEVLQSDLQVFAKYEKLNKSRIKQSNMDSLTIKQLQDSIPKLKHYYLWKGRKQGFWIGVAVDEAINVGSKLIKP